MNDPNYIIIHHSLTKDGKQVDWQAIKDYHVKEKGWNDIGYHLGIEGVDGKYMVLKGRDETTIGAHCKEGEMNRQSLGVCFVGNFDKWEVPEAQWGLGIRTVKDLMIKYKIPAVNVMGHGEVMRKYKASYVKSCPGDLFSMSKFRKDLLK